MTTVKLVAHVLWSGHVGGIERLVQDVACEQVRQGLEVAVVFGRAEGSFAEALARAGVPIVDLRLRSGSDLWPGRIARGADVLRCADVVHLHGFNPSFAALTLLARRPVVFTEHGAFGLGRRLGLSGSLKERLKRRYLRCGTAAIAANSRHTADHVCVRYGVEPAAVTVVPNGVDFDRRSAATAERRLANGGLDVAFVGRLVPFKRVDRLVAAVARSTNPRELRLTIVGGGPLEAELREQAGSLGVADRVDFVGFRDDADALLARADVLVQPSENEPFGLAIVEACAQGVLPIAFADGGGALETLPPEGIVVEDVEALAATLGGLSGSSYLSPEARERRAAWARATFPIARTAHGYLDLYQHALEGGRK